MRGVAYGVRTSALTEAFGGSKLHTNGRSILSFAMSDGKRVEGGGLVLIMTCKMS